MARTIAGIDIGNRTIRAVEIVDAAKGKPTLVRYAEAPLPEGSVNRGEILEPNTVAAAVKQLWSKAGFKTKDVVLGVGNQRVLARELAVRKAPLAQIRESLHFEVQDMLPVPVGDAILDFYPISETVGEAGPMVNGLLIAAVKEAVLGNVRSIESAGLNAVNVDLIPFALSRALVSRAGVRGTVALVDIGADTSTVVVTANGVPQFVRIIPTGGHDLTVALRNGLDMDEHSAESTKRSLGLASQLNSIDEKPAVDIIYQVVSEQLTSIRNTLVYYMNTRPNDPVTQVLLSGGGSRLIGLDNALAEMTHIPVQRVDPLASVSVAKSVSKQPFDPSGAAVALGLVLGSAA